MRKILYTPLVAFLLIVTACDKDYLEVEPTDNVSSQSVFTTTTNAWAALNGIHRNMLVRQDDQSEFGEGGVKVNFDILGEDLAFASASNSWHLGTYRWNDHRNMNSSVSQYVWEFYYRMIGNANMIINNIDGADGPDADKNAIKGQALVYRAWSHYQLVQVYGKRYNAGAANNQLGVPIMLVNTIEGQPRATVEEVYTQVNADLDEAMALLSEYERTYKSHFNVSVVKGLKARVALTMQRWAEAAEYASEVIEESGATLMSRTQYTEGFNNIDNPEWLWGSKQIGDQQTYFASFFAYMSANFNSTNIRVNPKLINSALYNQIPETDIRSEMWDATGASIPAPPNGTKAPYATKKFLAESAAISVGDVPHMRLAEMYLVKAEAQARLGQDDAAAETLFTLVSNRDPEYVKSGNTGQDLLNEILFQRRIELWGEGFRFLDLKRTNSPLNRTGANHNTAYAVVMTVEPGQVDWEFLIPQGEMNANSKMEQNPL
ncbi:RagB/SusD family nutrient uptake outer membrane protein [Pontibacter sp. SGAir0037]|uniref:RagB/SusD family nutrient uptake outer membrane protein n=1 Tax=Pontibacter sp. SGAir0037 TaxID=2571030 RepID=UPI0010CD074C|nr:RagB/SusD family nutrient uptake outer membrane protein [Pontibacter sp. SGAir0037]QCR22776.1 RagB/SusD family nutrient uptake outer membrane protein [Pontibacter sp. SGAir0037]